MPRSRGVSRFGLPVFIALAALGAAAACGKELGSAGDSELPPRDSGTNAEQDGAGPSGDGSTDDSSTSSDATLGDGGIACDGSPRSCGLRVVFVTSTDLKGDFGGRAAGSTECNKVAADAGLGGNYVAWIGATGSFTFSSPTAYYNTHGEIVSAQWPPQGDLLHAIQFDERRNVGGTPWSNLTTAPALSTPSCDEWMNGSTGQGRVGDHEAVDSTWTMGGLRNCFESHRIYCVETP